MAFFVPAEDYIDTHLLQKWGDVQYFSMSSPHLGGSLWKGVFKARLFVNLPRAPTAEDTEAWIRVSSGYLDKHGEPNLTQVKATRVKLRADKGGWTDINIFDLVTIFCLITSKSWSYTHFTDLTIYLKKASQALFKSKVEKIHLQTLHWTLSIG